MLAYDSLAVPPVKLTTVANRAFSVVGPRTWNDLPDDVTSAESLSLCCNNWAVSLKGVLLRIFEHYLLLVTFSEGG